jgi:hypothetical protein
MLLGCWNLGGTNVPYSNYEGENMNTFKTLVWKTKELFGWPRVKWEDSNKMDFKKTESKDMVEYVQMAQGKAQWQVIMVTEGSTKFDEFLTRQVRLSSSE